MQAIGVVLSVIAIWFMYCGTHGLKPLALVQAIIANPDQAGDLIDGAVGAAKASEYDFGDGIRTSDPTDQGPQGFVGTNPWASYKVTAPFGQSNHVGVIGSAHVHNGIDYAMPVGTKLPAVIAGNAVKGFGILSGTTLTITGTGTYKGWTTIYMHLSHVEKTGLVKAGTIVADSGGEKGAEGAGDSTGPHLHFEVHHNGAVVNPADFWWWQTANGQNIRRDNESALKNQLQNGYTL